jgi:uncharacterized membrane protein
MDLMTTIVTVFLIQLVLVYVGYLIGRSAERRSNRSREEAIRNEAYRAGSEWSADFWRKRCSQTEWNALYEGHFDPKENRHERTI